MIIHSSVVLQICNKLDLGCIFIKGDGGGLSSGSLVDPEPRSATQSPALWESNHLLEFEL